MKLVVHEINASLSQIFTPKKNTILGVIRPHLYIKGGCLGSIKVQITTEDDILICESNERLLTGICQTGFEYHGYVSFTVNCFLRKDTNYKLKILGSNGYSFNETSYAGICGAFDLKKYNDVYNIPNKKRAALDFEIWSLTQK